MPRNITVAAIQTYNRVGEKKENFRTAEALIEKAVREGAKIAALPELSSCGYAANDGIWDFGERRDGPTAQWASSLAGRLGVYIGAGFLECDGYDFYNSYLLANPRGGIDGIVRKNNAEAYCFKRAGEGPFCFETDIARIAIGICADSHYIGFFRRVRESRADLLLLPHGWATPYRKDQRVSPKDIEGAKKTVNQLAFVYAQYLGIPVAFINSVGEAPPMPGILGKFMSPETFRLQGASRIFGADGMPKAELTDAEGYAIAAVETGGMRQSGGEPPVFDGGWLHPGSKLARRVMIPFDIRAGQKYYGNSRLRAEKAAAVIKA